MRFLKKNWEGPAWAALVGILAILLLAGCASTKKVDEFPKTVEAVVEAEPAEPDRIDYIQVEPWQLNRGDAATVTVKGSADRSVVVTLEGVDGEAKGVSRQVELDAKAGGEYVGEIVAGDDLAPGRYRIEAEMSGGPSGDPTTLVSSRSLTIMKPKPTLAPWEALARKLQTPGIYFAFDKSDITDESMDYIEGVASDLREVGVNGCTLTIEGHCDERGTIEYNLALGARRAASVKKALASLDGMGPLTIETISRGEEEPVVPNASTEPQHAKNRRAELILRCER